MIVARPKTRARSPSRSRADRRRRSGVPHSGRRRAADRSNDSAFATVTDQSGNIYVAGEFRGTAIFGGTAYSAAGPLGPLRRQVLSGRGAGLRPHRRRPLGRPRDGDRGRRGAERLSHRLLHDLGGVQEPAVERRLVGESPGRRQHRHSGPPRVVHRPSAGERRLVLGAPDRRRRTGRRLRHRDRAGSRGSEQSDRRRRDRRRPHELPALYEGDGDISPDRRRRQLRQVFRSRGAARHGGQLALGPRGRTGQRQRVADRRRGRRQRPGLRLGPLPGGDEHRHRSADGPAVHRHRRRRDARASGRSGTSRAPAPAGTPACSSTAATR